MLLRLKNIGKIYDSNDILTIGIRGVNLDFDYNEFVTIEGESGSGKSTLLNVIAANDSYEEGELYFNGAETSHYSETDWEKYREKNIAMIFQDFNIIENLTVLENVELALLRVEDKIERRKTAEDLIAKVGLTAQKNRKGSKLSGGEKQRTVIARALAKDSPVILADEPTGNLDVKASKEVAALLKAVSKDKLVIVVTHNPEFFVKYATRRVTIFDGSVKEDQVIRKPLPKTSADKEEIKAGKWQNFKNTMHIGTLNYKSRPKFTAMMSFALFVCAITLFLVISVFGNSLIRPTQVPLDGTGVTGKVILSNRSNSITQSDLDEVAGQTKAGYFLLDRNLSEFSVDIPKRGGLSSSYTLTCLYDPYKYCPEAGNAVLIMSKSEDGDAETIKNMIVNAEIGIKNITLKTTVDLTEPKLYLGYDDLNAYGKKMQSVNSVMKLGNNETTVFTFRAGEELAAGEENRAMIAKEDLKEGEFFFVYGNIVESMTKQYSAPIGIYRYVSKSTAGEGDSAYTVWDVQFVSSAGGYNANQISCSIYLGDISDKANIVRYEVMEGAYYYFSGETNLYIQSVSKIHANAFTACEEERLSSIKYSPVYMGSAISKRQKLSALVNDENCASVFEEGWYAGYTDDGLGSMRMQAL